MSDGEAALTDQVRGKTAAGVPFDLASQADIIDLRDQLLAALDDIRLAIINEVDALEAALLSALADVEAAIAAADTANVAAIEDARDQLLAAIAALQAANTAKGDDIIAAVQAAQAALEAALETVRAEVEAQGVAVEAAIVALEATLTSCCSTLDASLNAIEAAVIAEGDETQTILTTIRDEARGRLNAFATLLNAQPRSISDEVRRDPLNVNDSNEYLGRNTDGASTAAATWEVVQLAKTAGEVTRIRYRTGVVWDDRHLGWA